MSDERIVKRKRMLCLVKKARKICLWILTVLAATIACYLGFVCLSYDRLDDNLTLSAENNTARTQAETEQPYTL
jgi:hypothetical protein